MGDQTHPPEQCEAMTIRESFEAIEAMALDYDYSSAERMREIAATAAEALTTLDACELISEYAGGDATAKSHWRYISDPQSASAEGKNAPPEACGSRVAPCGAQHGAPNDWPQPKPPPYEADDEDESLEAPA